MSDNHLIPLGFMNPGEEGVLEEIRGLRHHVDSGRPHAGIRPAKQYQRGHMFHTDRGHRLEHRLNCMGLVPGEPVKVVQNNAPGPVVVAVKGSRLCLGRGIASKLMVRPESNDSVTGAETPPGAGKRGNGR